MNCNADYSSIPTKNSSKQRLIAHELPLKLFANKTTLYHFPFF